MVAVLAIAFCGSMFAQETHWPFNTYAFEDQMPLVAFVQLDGSFIESDNCADFEVGAFVGEEVRGTAFFTDYTIEFGDPHPIIEMSLYFSSDGEPVTFKLYNHATEEEYVDFTCNYDIFTGEEHVEEYFDYDEAVVISFVSPAPAGFEKPILGYSAEDNNHWYLIASPVGQVSPENVDNMLLNDYDLYAFDQSEELEWRQYGFENTTFNLEPGMGYLYANSENDTLVFTGTAYDGEGTVTLDKDNEAVLSGWNLVGNPFAAEAYIGDRNFYRMNEDGTDLIADPTTGAIAPMEGVFVIAETDGEELTFTTEAPAPEPVLVMNVTKGRGAAIDRAAVRFGEGRALPKLQLNPNSTKLYIPVDNEDYAVVSSEGVGEMPVSFKAEKSGTYTLSFTCQEVSFGYLHLIDNLNGNDVDLLANPSYTFDASSTDYASRFRLVFATGNTDDSFAFFSNGSLVVNNDGNATLQVVDVTGRLLSSQNVNGCASVNLNAAPGVYMIRLVNGDNVKVQKVVVE